MSTVAQQTKWQAAVLAAVDKGYNDVSSILHLTRLKWGALEAIRLLVANGTLHRTGQNVYRNEQPKIS